MQVQSKYPNECKNGVDGIHGLPGIGGLYGDAFMRGKYFKENVIRSLTEHWEEEYDKKIVSSLRSENGSISNELNSENIKNAKTIDKNLENHLIYESLTEYFKFYFQEAFELKNSRLDYDLFNNFMGDFSLKLNPDLFNIINRVKIFNRIEHAHLLPSLRNEMYNKNFQTNSEKLLKNYIELSISTLMRRFNLEKDKIFVIDLEKYIEITLDQIKDWKNWSQQEILNGLKLNYESNLDDKIKEANELIDTLQENIENNIHKFNSNIYDILMELKTLKEKVKNEASKLESKKIELEKNLAMKSIFTILQAACQVLKFIGPKGALIGSIGEAGIDMVSKIAELNIENITINSDIKKIDNLMQKNLKNFNKMQIKKVEKQIDILEIKNKIEKKLNLKKDKKQNHLSKVENLPASEAKSKLEAAYNYLLSNKFEDIKKYESKLKEFIKFKQIKKSSSNQNKIDAALEVAKLINDFADEKQLLSNEIELVEEEIRKSPQRYEYLNDVENEINDLQSNAFIEINKELSLFKKNLQLNISNARLDLNKFKIKETLNNLKHEILKFMNELEGKEELEYTMKRIENAILTMFDIYSHIENYFQQKEFSNFMSAIIQNQKNILGIPDEYQVQIKSLQKSIQENVIIRMYQKVEEAFKYWSFPFYNDYMQKNLINDVEIDFKIGNYENKLKEIQAIVKDDKSALNPLKDNRLIYNVFDKKNPFFEWNSKNNLFEIKSLLNGEKTLFYADIKKTKITEYADAIKFNKISIELEVSSQQNETLNELLQHFNIELTHSGISFYKYDEINVEYNFGEKILFINRLGNDETLNESAKKLASKRPILSPYTFWDIKLETKDLVKKKQLKHFFIEEKYSSIKLFLCGHGSYIDSK